MTVVTRQRSDRFAIIPNAVAEDSRLSFEARGVLCYLLAKPHNWQVQISDIQKAGNVGRDKVYRILRELRAQGYIRLVVRRDDQARIVSHDYFVYDDAVPDQLPLPEKPEVGEPLTENPEVEKLLPEKPYTAEPYTADTDGLIRTQKLTKTHPPASAREGEEGFKIWWEEWPEKYRLNDPKAGLHHFNKVPADLREKLREASRAYCRAKVARNQIPRMVAFLKTDYREFVDPPEIDAKGRFIIKPGRPEWSPWLGVIRREHGERGVDNIVKTGFWLTTERWPPKQPTFA